MKVRAGFVSNSSTTTFLFAFEKDKEGPYIKSSELSGERIIFFEDNLEEIKKEEVLSLVEEEYPSRIDFLGIREDELPSLSSLLPEYPPHESGHAAKAIHEAADIIDAIHDKQKKDILFALWMNFQKEGTKYFIATLGSDECSGDLEYHWIKNEEREWLILWSRH